MEQRPAAMISLNFAQVVREFCFERRVRPVKIVVQEDEFGRYRRVGLELINPMAVPSLLVSDGCGDFFYHSIEQQNFRCLDTVYNSDPI